ncbi:ATP-grasp domain-containing protein [Pelomonas sp. KK5]|uniref:ATP-grasp domain-containing protein n=1 Tax=Pelomonas sp. KK5 TaxID=1855730 RepID=UPI00097BED4A|nr:ATP-grasp domain-containing protein [Pelomonas sp. KK5]
MNDKRRRVFVYEYVSGGGAMPDAATAAELLPLGLAMRDAMAADLRLLPDCETTVAGADGLMPDPGEAAFDFVARQAALHDLAWIVAPESGGLLAEMARMVGPERWIGCTAEAIELCTSKRATLQALSRHGVATPLDFAAGARQWVLKPDDGAGCVDTRRVDAPQQLPGMCCEPWVDGQAFSVSLLCGPAGVEVLALNRQDIGIDAEGRLSFDGVAPNAQPLDAATARLARQVGAAIPGLRGFVGIDLVRHPEHGPVLIEVNPRVTVAYAGMSRALGRNLAGEILGEQRC